LHPFYIKSKAWKEAQQADEMNFVSEYAKRNEGLQDINESLVAWFIVR